MDIKEKLNEGYIHCRAIVELLGKPKDYVDNAIKMYVERMKKDKELIILNTEFSEPEAKEELFMVFVEVEMLAKNSEKLVWFCFDYMPSSIEVIEPRQIGYKAEEFSNFLNDLQARLHDLDLRLKINIEQNKILKNNATNLMKNIMKLSLMEKDKDITEISKNVGISEEQLEPFLTELIKQGSIEKKGDFYSWKI